MLLMVVIKQLRRNYPYQIHILVAMVFLPNPENKPTVDRNRENNHILNLRWTTMLEQSQNRKNKIKYWQASMSI